MKDNLDEQLDGLFAAARAQPLDTSRMEFAFETRLAARLRAEQGASLFAWAWRLCPFFAALALAMAWWSHGQADASGTIFSEALPVNEEQMLVSYLTGERP